MKQLWNREQRKSAFQSEAMHPATWIIRVKFLKEAFEKLNSFGESRSSSHLVWIEYMLLGMALESLIKGHMVFRGINAVEQGKRRLVIAKPFKSHELHRLAKHIECPALPISAQDYSLLEKLSVFVKWAGRYPIPTDDQTMGPQQASNKEHDKICKLFSRLLERLERGIG